MTNREFVENVLRIAENNPTYRTGGDGSDGTCDCIGLIMGALGGSFEMHSSNWFARYQLSTIDEIGHEVYEPIVGEAVLKARNPSNPRYDLHERYVTGRYSDTGDLLDYYHIGVVTSIAPLEITHCTSTGNANGIVRDNTLDGWTHTGRIKRVAYDAYEADEPLAEKTANDIAVVYTEDGNPARMRSKPTTDGAYNTVAKVPKGALVEIIEQAGEWATVRWYGQRGYMMSKYLRVIGMAPVEPEPAPADGYTITLSAGAAAELLAALRKAGVVW